MDLDLEQLYKQTNINMIIKNSLSFFVTTVTSAAQRLYGQTFPSGRHGSDGNVMVAPCLSLCVSLLHHLKKREPDL